MSKEHHISGASHLILFSLVQIIVYCDRSVIGGMVSVIQKNFNVDSFEVGLLGSVFMFTFVLLSTTLSLRVKEDSIPLVIIFGLITWMVAMAICGLATDNYYLLVIGRALSGAGEAAYCCFAPPMIDDTAPIDSKSTYLSVYFMCIFLGSAVGYLVQGLFSTWEYGRYLFLGEACAMLPLVIVLILCKDKLVTGSGEKDHCLKKHSINSAHSLKRVPKSSANSFVQLCSFQFILLNFGYAASVFTLGGMLFWLPKYMVKYIHISRADTGLMLGVLTLFSGISGSLFGGIALDKLGGSSTEENTNKHRVHRSLMGARFSLAAISVAVVCLVLMVFVASTVSFAIFTFLSECMIFTTTTPIMVSIMEITKPNLRPLSMGVSTLVAHALGDLISPALIGYVESSTGSLWNGMLLMCAWPLWSVLFWGLASCKVGLRQEATEAMTPLNGE